MASVFQNIALKILLITNGLILTAVAMMGPIYAIFVEEIGGDLLDAGLTGAAYALTAGTTTLLVGKLVDKVKEKELVIVAGYIVIGIAFLLFTGVHSIWTLAMVQALIGFGEALYSPAFDSVYSDHLDKRKSGLQWGAWEAMNYFTWAAGATVGGFLVSMFSFDHLFVLMSLLAFGAALYIYLTPRKVL